MTDDGDDGRASIEEYDTAGEIRAAAQRMQAAANDLTRAVDDAKLGATAGVAAAYRQEVLGLSNRMEAFADNLVEDDEPEEDNEEA